MPPKKNSKYIKKAVVSKVKKQIATVKKVKATKNMDTHFLQVKTDGIVYPKQGVATSNYIYGFIPLLSDSSTFLNITSLTQFKQYCAMYDRVRINSVSIKFLPKANTFDAGAAQQDATLNVSGSGTYYTILDRDGPGPWVSNGMPDLYKQYPSCKQTSVLKSHSRVYSVKYPTGVWLDTSNIFSDSTLLNRLGLNGGLTYYGENLVEDNGEIYNEPWASMIIAYNCVFEGTKPTQVSFSGGVITITPVETSLSTAIANFSPLLSSSETPLDTTEHA